LSALMAPVRSKPKARKPRPRNALLDFPERMITSPFPSGVPR
jgi:hypothetical protein